MTGWIKLYRQTVDDGWLQNAELWTFWCYCLLKASHKKHTARVGYQRIELMPGQLIFGRKKAAAELETTERKIRTYLKILQTEGNVTIKTTNKYSVITICKWETYQLIDIENDQQSASKRPASDQQATTYNNDKKVKNEKKKKKDMFRTTEKNVVQEPPNEKSFSDHEWSKDVVGIISKYPTLSLVIADTVKNGEFWDGHVDIMSNYFPTDSEMKRWFNQKMFEINNWQRDRPHQQSRTAKGLRQRISRWLGKEYQKLEVTKR